MKPNDPIDIDPNYNEDFLDQDVADDGTYDDAEIYDENWEEESAGAQTKSKKKKSSLFTILLVGGAVVIGGGILATQLGKSPDPAPPSMDQAAQTTEPTMPGMTAPDQVASAQTDPAALPAPAPETAATDDGGFMNDPSQLPAATNNDPSAPAPSLPDAPSMTGFDAPEVVSDTDTLPVPQNLPSIDLIKKAGPAIDAGRDSSLPETTDISSAADSGAQNNTASAPSAMDLIEERAKLDDAPAATTTPAAAAAAAPVATETAPSAELQSKLEQVVTRLDALETKISNAPAQTAPSANSEDISSLRSAIERLENKVENLSQAPSRTVSSSTASYVDDDSEQEIRVVKPVRKAVRKRAASVEAAAPSPTTWELRGAWPGEAMISRPGQAELKSVRVGETVAGIGQVQSISQIGGTWVVEGTTGRISQ